MSHTNQMFWNRLSTAATVRSSGAIASVQVTSTTSAVFFSHWQAEVCRSTAQKKCSLMTQPVFMSRSSSEISSQIISSRDFGNKAIIVLQQLTSREVLLVRLLLERDLCFWLQQGSHYSTKKAGLPANCFFNNVRHLKYRPRSVSGVNKPF